MNDIKWKSVIVIIGDFIRILSIIEVMEWMLDIQLGRRNLSPIQRIAIAEKYRPIYEKQAKENQGQRNDLKNNITVNLPQSLSNSNENRNPTTAEKLASVAGVSEKTYRMGAKILNSDNKEVKDKVLSSEMSINAGYNKIIGHKNISMSYHIIKIEETHSISLYNYY